MGMYQDRMISDMRMRGYSEKTQSAYTWHMRLFIKFCKALPDRISLDDVVRYQRHLVDRGLS